jgi:hypothetical protein
MAHPAPTHRRSDRCGHRNRLRSQRSRFSGDLLYATFNGSPLKSVPIDTRYTWPFNHVDQNYIRATVTDTWWINDVLTINNRYAAHDGGPSQYRQRVCTGPPDAVAEPAGVPMR